MTFPLFTHASLWPFLLALLVPVWLHLRRRRGLRSQVLPTFALLQKALGQQTPVMRWRQIFLLISRLLALLFLILAFLKPVIPAELAPPVGGPRAVVIVLDTSLSMRATNGGVSAMGRASGQALALLDDLRYGDMANVILCGGAARSVLPKLSGDFGTLRQAVRSAVPTYERGNSSSAVALAASELAEAASPNRQLIIASDFQQTGWTPDVLAQIPADVRLALLEAGENAPENAAITSLRLPTPAPAPGEAANLTATVWNGANAARNLTVSLEIAREEGAAPGLPDIAPQTVSVPPFASAVLNFAVSFPDPARYRVMARLPADSLPPANSRYLVVDLQDRLNVLLLTDSRFSDAEGATFLRRALNPAPDVPGGFRVTIQSPARLSAGDLRASDVVLCDELETLPSTQIALLARYLADGGAALLFLANPQSAAQISALAKQNPGGGAGLFQPETYLDVRRLGKGYITLNPPKSAGPLLRLFADAAVADLTKIRFTRYFLTAPPDANAEILLTFEDGTPALARCDFGRGSLLLANFSASPLAGDLAKQTLFPPLVHELAQGMAVRNAERTEILCGGTFTAPGSITVSNLSRPGFYRAETKQGDATAFAVNVAPEETDLRRADLIALQAKRGFGPSSRVGKNGNSLSSLRYHFPLWPYCVLLALLLLLIEFWLAGQRQK